MHIARHSFGNISGDKIPIQMLQKLYSILRLLQLCFIKLIL
ncbi:hypothetical protein JCM19274_2813 [Algibacter lectus]|uniref:Uncharacterized protein n=1 Tax=Algibacter lectus TaxID=221126 RepID=A0A090X6Y7_9FLAO|nr:hypothetical protein JCM19274_2813 [Algibacter lectus]